MAATGVGVRVRLGLGLAELVRDLRLDTEFEGDDTIIHLYHDRPGHRAIPRRETWKREKMLGSGGYGEVWLEKQVENPSWLAVKQISAKCSQSIVDLCKVELEAFAKFSRQKYAKCFVQSSGWYEGPGFISISMEYCPKGDLNHYLAWRGKLPEDEVQDIVSQVVEGLHFMHGEGFVHRDLKPGNIIIKSSLLDDHWWVKLCDFGLSKRIGEGSGASTTVKGTAGFLAPELFGFDGIDPRKVNRFAADIWSLGEMAFRILAGKATFPSVGRLRDYQLGTVAFPIEELHGVGTSELCISFIKTAMASEPKERFEAHQAMSHDWMKAQTYIMLRRALYQGTFVSFNSLMRVHTPNRSPTHAPITGIEYPITEASGQWSTATVSPLKPETDTRFPPRSPSTEGKALYPLCRLSNASDQLVTSSSIWESLHLGASDNEEHDTITQIKRPSSSSDQDQNPDLQSKSPNVYVEADVIEAERGVIGRMRLTREVKRNNLHQLYKLKSEDPETVKMIRNVVVRHTQVGLDDLGNPGILKTPLGEDASQNSVPDTKRDSNIQHGAGRTHDYDDGGSPQRQTYGSRPNHSHSSRNSDMLPSHHKTTHTKQTFESPPDDKVQQSDNRSRYQNVHLDHSPPSEVPPDVYLMKDAGFRRDGASPGRGFISANRDRLAVPQVDYHPLRARYPPSAPGNPSGGFEFSSVFAEFTRGCANETGDEKEIPSPYDRTKQRRGPPIGGGATIHQQGDQGIFYSSSTSSTSRHPFKPPPGFGAVSPQSVSPQSADRWHNVQFSDPRRNYLANVSYPFGYIDVQWTKIDRNVVSPEALIGRESFYVTSNHVMVFATLTLEEVEDYASVTRTMQGQPPMAQ